MKGAVFYTFPLAMAMVCIITSRPTNAMSCGDIDLNLSECVWYLAGRDVHPSRACCDGVRHLEKLGPTSGDKRVACDCMRETMQHVHGIISSLVDSLPSKCTAKLPYVKYLDHCDGEIP